MTLGYKLGVSVSSSSVLAALTQVNHGVFLALNPDPLAGGGVPWLVELARLASAVLPDLLLALTLAALLLGPRVGLRRQQVLAVVLAMGLAWLITRSIQVHWPQPRPFVLGLGSPWVAHGASASFPSRHATVAMAWAVALLFWRKPWLSALALFMGVMIAWSRVALGVHFPVDVLAGALVGTLAAVLAYYGLNSAWVQRGLGQAQALLTRWRAGVRAGR